MSWWRALHAALLVLLVGSRGGAQEREPGIWAEGVFGGGVAIGSFESEGIETRLTGGGLDLAGTIGHTLSDNWAFGIVPSLTLGPFSGGIDNSSVDLGYMASVSVAAAVRAPPTGVMLRVAIGVERAAFAGGTDDIGGGPTTRGWDFPPVHGPVFGLAWGRAKELSGLAFRFSYARLRGEQASYDVIAVGFGFLLERWGEPARPR